MSDTLNVKIESSFFDPDPETFQPGLCVTVWIPLEPLTGGGLTRQEITTTIGEAVVKELTTREHEVKIETNF